MAAALGFLLSRKIKRKLWRALIVLVFCILITPVLYFISAYLISDIATNATYEPFDKEKWFSDKGNRYKYSLDIDTINGKTSDEVIELLGMPDSRSQSLFQYDLISEDNWRSKYGFNPWMNIEFKNDTVSAHYIVSD